MHTWHMHTNYADIVSLMRTCQGIPIHHLTPIEMTTSRCQPELVQESVLLVHRGGLRFGALAGLFYAVQQVSSIARAEKGLQDIIVAGTATGAVFGATGEQLLQPFLAVGSRNTSSATHTYVTWVHVRTCQAQHIHMQPGYMCGRVWLQFCC